MGGPDKKPPVSSATGDTSSRTKWNSRRKRHGNRTTTIQPTKFKGGKEELDGNYFDCTGYGQSNRFVKTVQKIADYVGQEYKSGGIARTKVVTQAEVIIPAPARPTCLVVIAADGTTTQTAPDLLDISDYQNAKKIVDYKVQHQAENRQKIFSLV